MSQMILQCLDQVSNLPFNCHQDLHSFLTGLSKHNSLFPQILHIYLASHKSLLKLNILQIFQFQFQTDSDMILLKFLLLKLTLPTYFYIHKAYRCWKDVNVFGSMCQCHPEIYKSPLTK